MALQPDGKIVAAGSLIINNVASLWVGRFEAGGGLDPDFHPEISDFHAVRTVAVQKDGQILLGAPPVLQRSEVC